MYKYFFKSSPKPSKSGYDYKMMHSYEKRKMESERLKQKCPNLIPIIIEKSDVADVPELDKNKFLINPDITVSQILIMIRKHIKLNEKEAIFVFINNKMIPSLAKTIGELYKEQADKDGFLYITYSTENTFGCN